MKLRDLLSHFDDALDWAIDDLWLDEYEPSSLAQPAHPWGPVQAARSTPSHAV